MKTKVAAKVRWFDKLKGEGVIRVGEKSIFVHWSAIAKGLNLNCSGDRDQHCVLFRGQDVLVDIYEDSHFTQIDCVYGVVA